MGQIYLFFFLENMLEVNYSATSFLKQFKVDAKIVKQSYGQ